jgi:translin
MKNDGIDADMDEIASKLSEKQKNFDTVMDTARQIIRLAGQSITMLHNEATADAVKKIKEMKSLVERLQNTDADFRYNSLQAYQEYTEAMCFYWIKTQAKLPRVSDLEVPYDAYLLGLMDVVGELKREVLEALSKNNIKSAESYLTLMKKIYDSSRSIRFAEAVLPGFRRKQDVARIQIEGAGSEILSARHAKRL